MPRSFSKGKRGISGTLVFVVFDRDALLETLRQNLESSGIDNLYTAKGNMATGYYGFGEDSNWNQGFGLSEDGVEPSIQQLYRSMTDESDGVYMKYIDQFPPFDITISMANELGNTSSMKIHGVQILNEGSGMSIDDMVVEKACTFVARGITPLGYDKMSSLSGTSKGSGGGRAPGASGGYFGTLLDSVKGQPQANKNLMDALIQSSEFQRLINKFTEKDK